MSVNLVENETKVPYNIQVITHYIGVFATMNFFRNLILLILGESGKKYTLIKYNLANIRRIRGEKPIL